VRKYLRNVWYMAGWASEVGRSILSRKILDEELILFRQGNGKPVALADLCPHRFAPLSRGTIIGDFVRCGYHGLQFDATGRCVKQHFSSVAPAQARVKSFPIVEQDQIVWLWMGNPEEANLSLIPRFPYLTSPQYKATNGMSKINAYYELITDNLMDLSHGEFIHPDFGGVLHLGKHTVRQEQHTVHSNWWTPDVEPTFVINLWWPENGGRVDHWLDMRWDPPASMFLEVGSTRPGQPRDQGFHQPSVHILTPETDSSTHYFWNGGLPADHFQNMDELNKILAHAFDEEDAPIIEAVQRKMGERSFEEMKPVLLAPDKGAIRVRRVLEALLRAEETSRQTAA
jgi:phenylpropionate dioxygenase-like ring-hydroxylating dioxygenase large terminal subunit